MRPLPMMHGHGARSAMSQQVWRVRCRRKIHHGKLIELIYALEGGLIARTPILS